MKALSVAGALAAAITFGTAMALAQTGPRIGDGTNSPPVPPTTPGYNIGTGSAHLGDGRNTQPVSSATPGYSIGTSASPKDVSGHIMGQPTPPASLGLVQLGQSAAQKQ